MSRADRDFQMIFLCFYRKFAAPTDLLNSILSKFDKVDSEESIFLLQMNDKLRILQRLHCWVWECPGDFADLSTRHAAIDFARSIENNRTFAGMAKDMIAILEGNIEDEDAMWGKKDTDSHRISMPSYLMHNSSRKGSIVATASFISNGSDESSFANLSTTERVRKESYASVSPRLDGLSGTMNMTPLLENMPQMSPQAIKEQYSVFIELSDEDIAHELTRIDWLLFSRIKPRDIVRHVSVPAGEKDRMKSLKYVNRLIRHFNHIAYWVASIILERPKPKHRAKALEKFMNIAWVCVAVIMPEKI